MGDFEIAALNRCDDLTFRVLQQVCSFGERIRCLGKEENAADAFMGCHAHSLLRLQPNHYHGHSTIYGYHGHDARVSRRKKRSSEAVIFGTAIRRLRTDRGLTQEALAELADLNVSYIGFLERGENVPTLSIVLNLADALNVDAGELVREVARKR